MAPTSAAKPQAPEALELLAAGALRPVLAGLLVWVAGFLVWAYPLFGARTAASTALLAVVTASVPLPVLWLRQGRLQLASWAFLACQGLVLALMTVLSGGIASPTLGYGLGLIATAAWLLGHRAAIFSAVALIAWTLLLAAGAQLGIPQTPYLPFSPLATWALLAGFAVITTVPLTRSLDALRRAVKTLTRTEEALRASEDRYRALIETSPDAITVTDLEGRIVMCNQQTAVMHGYASWNALIGRNAFELVVAEERERAGAGMLKVLRGEVLRNAQHTLLRADGSTFPGEMSVSRITGSDGQPAAFMAVSRDITERRRLEAEIHQAQKMESIGLLAGGVAHDFNNLITIIRCYTDMAMADLPESGAAAESLAEVGRAAEKAAKLTGQLLAFSRKQVFRPRVVNLNSIVGGLENMLRTLVGEQVELVTALAPDLGNAEADPSQIEQVLMNLAANARDAMPEGGKLFIETANTTLPGQAGGFVSIAVRDTGTGINETILPRIFEPFFTTKGHGRGTGLGLSVVYGIVKQNSGEIRVESEPGRGTTFRIYLPRAGGEAVADLAGEGERKLQGGMETVLIVDDEAPIRLALSEVLRKAGYSVLCAEGGDGALRLCTDHAGAIDLLLTDVRMPGMSGDELGRRVSELRPETRILYMSGYADEPLFDRTPEFLPKPFSPAVLVQRVRTVLDAAAPAKL